ncbi:hypothetical protein LTR09_012552 [Extremus antarcticus]|uniref:Uncharacterized protein n=1 Tax=Extremus antarcticus TaxID=702011 RepID=A0AAJ0D9P3_9PEZI|nr:hypothetical protein LTR09_012552 [Extremus antarcticus]
MWPSDPDGKQCTTDRMKRELQQASEHGLGQSINVAAYREIAIAISRKWLRSSAAFQQDEDEESIEYRLEDIDDDTADEQATHSPHIAGLIYARNIMEMFAATADKRARFRDFSKRWHRFLGFAPAVADMYKDGERMLPFEEEAKQACFQRRCR